jgi:hypothetical protein
MSCTALPASDQEPSPRHARRFTTVLVVVSLLRGPTTIAVHGESGTRWSLRASPVPLRVASSAGLAPGSRAEILAAQVVRAVAQDGARQADIARAVILLRRILELGESSDDAEWARVRIAVVDLMLRASDHPPTPVHLVPWQASHGPA